jgi:hypothetical protein
MRMQVARELPHKIETTANIATIAVAVLLSAVLLKVYVLRVPAPQRPRGLAEAGVGTNLKGRLPGVDWSKNGRTLVLGYLHTMPLL